MKKLKVVSKILEFASKHEVGIRAGAIIGSTLAAVYFAAKDSPRLMKKLDELNAEGASNTEKAKEAVKIMGRTAIATGSAVLLTVNSAGRAANVIAELGSAATTFCSLATDTKKDNDAFIEHAKKIVGEEKVQEIRRSIADEKYPEKQPGGNYVPKVIDTGHGNDLFYVEFTKDWILSDAAYIRNEFLNIKNKVISGYDTISWNEAAYALGIPARRNLDFFFWTDEMLKKLDDRELVKFDCGIRDDNKVYTILELEVEPEYMRGRH